MRFVNISGVNSLTFVGAKNCVKQRLKRQPKLYHRSAVGADCELPNWQIQQSTVVYRTGPKIAE
jgi:hypothetical protein